MAEIMALRPQEGPQTLFLSSPADIVFYGGGAGGGKTWALLFECLRYLNIPRMNVVIFRRTYPQITAPGGLLDASREIFPLVGGVLRSSELEWMFPSGAKVLFRHLKLANDVFAWQGSELVLILWDEVTHFHESQFWYLMSRNRSTCGVTPYVRATCNPDPDSFVAELISWYLNDDGLPDPERSGHLRYFIREGGQIIWVDETYRDAETGLRPKSLTFIPSSIYDNPALLKANPDYLTNLRSLPLIERERLLGGNWKVKATAGKVFKTEWFSYVEESPQAFQVTRFWDFAATNQEISGGDPDWTVGAKLALFNERYSVLDIVRLRGTPAEVDKTIVQTAIADGQGVTVRWFQDPGQAGLYQTQKLRGLLRAFDSKGVTSQIGKQQRAAPFSRACEFGEVSLLRSHWNNTFLNELSDFPDGPHDDQVDAVSGAYLELTGEGSLKFGTAKFS